LRLNSRAAREEERMATILEAGRQMLRGEREPFPVARLLGMVLKAIEPGRAGR
jgi:hypothetical protein